ncbi:hypothetical protein ACFYYD_06350 [Streptomyces bluensis]|uniref:hypothetical protein n=1 Tax=Streptomyces bluensis TaxID=33897 RepID=UPI0036899DF0
MAGSENDTSFAVVDFTNPTLPKRTLVNPGFGAGCRVALGGHSAAVGNVLGGDVRVVNVANPASPVLQGKATTVLAGIGGLAIRKTLVVIGESANNFKARAVAIDFSRPTVPVVLGTAHTALSSNGGPAISSVAFVSDYVVMVSGADFEIVQVDFTIPGSPVVTNFNPRLAGPPVIDVDANARIIAAGDSTSGILKWFDADSKTQLGSINTKLTTINSVAIAVPRILVASQNEFNADLIDLVGPTRTAFNPRLGGGSVTAIEGTTGLCGAILGSTVALVDVSGAPNLLGTADATIPSISTVAMSTV